MFICFISLILLLSLSEESFPIVYINNKPAWYIDQSTKRIKITQGNKTPYLEKEKEYGALLSFEIHTDILDTGVLIELNNRNNQKTIINELSARELLRLGRGMTPGDMQDVAGVSPDPAGKPLSFYPYVARAKNTTELDAISDIGRGIVMRYEPTYPLEYTGIKVVFLNTATFSSLFLRTNIKRAIFLTQIEIDRLKEKEKNV